MLKTYHYKFSCRLCMHLSCSSHSHSSISVRSDFYYCVSSQGLGTVEANRNICFFFPLIFYTTYSVLFTLKNTMSCPQLLLIYVASTQKSYVASILKKFHCFSNYYLIDKSSLNCRKARRISIIGIMTICFSRRTIFLIKKFLQKYLQGYFLFELYLKPLLFLFSYSTLSLTIQIYLLPLN